MPPFLKSHDVAILLDLSPDDVNIMARKGLIKGKKIGKRWRFRNHDVNKFLDQVEPDAPIGISICRMTRSGKSDEVDEQMAMMKESGPIGTL